MIILIIKHVRIPIAELKRDTPLADRAISWDSSGWVGNGSSADGQNGRPFRPVDEWPQTQSLVNLMFLSSIGRQFRNEPIREPETAVA